jgi:hypothetical protein
MEEQVMEPMSFQDYQDREVEADLEVGDASLGFIFTRGRVWLNAGDSYAQDSIGGTSTLAEFDAFIEGLQAFRSRIATREEVSKW